MTRHIEAEFVTGAIWEVETKMTEHLLIPQSLQSLNNSKQDGRTNFRSVDILKQISKVLSHSLDHVTLQPCKSQDPEEEDSGKGGEGS